jgi:hypothetical protein
MALTVSVRGNIAKAAAQLDTIANKQIPYASKLAVDALAEQVKVEITAALPSIFGHTVPFTRTAIHVQKARSKRDPSATVFVLPLQARYLSLEEFGGTRTPAMNTRKPSRALTMPGVGAEVDANGNLPFRYVGRLFAAARQQRTARTRFDARVAQRQAKAQQSRSGRKLQPLRRPATIQRDSGIVQFKGSGPHGRSVGGLFERVDGHRLRRLIAFEDETHYRPKFGFRDRAGDIVRRNFAAAFDAAIARALQPKGS